MLPPGFTYLEDPRIVISLGYLNSYNFLGRPVAGYHAPLCILTEQAADALIAVQDELDTLHPGYQLKIFDAYRPTTAVADFKKWAMDPNHQEMKAIFYPDIDKSELFKQGYIAEKSSHSRGSTVDLTIIMIDKTELDMGTVIDFFGEKTHTAFPNIPDNAKKNRMLLKHMMEKQGFQNYPLEWWHFTLKNEPFPDTYFDFPVR